MVELYYNTFDDIYYSEEGTNCGKTNIQDKGLTCEFLINSNSEEILTCFYTVYFDQSYLLAIAYFKINGETSIESVSLNKHFNIGLSLDYIKSSTTIDHSKALICYYLYDGKAECFIYDLFDNINDITKNLFEYEGKCKQKVYGLKVSYFPQNQQFVFTCLLEDKGIQIASFNNNLTFSYEEDLIFIDCKFKMDTLYHFPLIKMIIV